MIRKPEPDPRRHAYRPDLADRRLMGSVLAARFVDGQPAVVSAGCANLHRAPRFDAVLDTQALHGETLRVFDAAEGWAWCQLDGDGYVGYIAAEQIAIAGSAGADDGSEIASVTALQALAFAAPDIKTPQPMQLPFGSRLRIVARSGNFLQLDNGRFVHIRHTDGTGTRPDGPCPDPSRPDPTRPEFYGDHVDTALRFLGVPYLWGGKTCLGLDCSGLVQIAMNAAGLASPRDTNMQEVESGGDLGPPIYSVGADDAGGPNAPAKDARLPDLRRGDLLFWPGHVGMISEPDHLLHANAFHMMVVNEPLAPALARMAANGNRLRTVRRPLKAPL